MNTIIGDTTGRHQLLFMASHRHILTVSTVPWYISDKKTSETLGSAGPEEMEAEKRETLDVGERWTWEII